MQCTKKLYQIVGKMIFKINLKKSMFFMLPITKTIVIMVLMRSTFHYYQFSMLLKVPKCLVETSSKRLLFSKKNELLYYYL